mgnify:CR=1 FL=1
MNDTIDLGWDTNHFAVGDVVRRNLVRGSVWPQDLVVTAINGNNVTLGLSPILSNVVTSPLGLSQPNRKARRRAKAIARRAK